MKLPNFDDHPGILALKQAMGLPRDARVALDLIVKISFSGASDFDEAIISGEGIEIAFEEIMELPDGMFAVNGSRVLVYIRDVSSFFKGEPSLPKYHFMSCSVIADMKARRRFKIRYVVNAEKDGIFRINFMNGGAVRSEKKKLNVCQACLSCLAYGGYSYGQAREERQRIVADFTPAKFFEQYPRSLHRDVPEYDWENAPIDDYTKDFPAVSRQMREGAKWRCQQCVRDFSASKHRRFLHVHHLERKSDNRPEVLKVLCLECHAAQPGHSHMKNLPEFKQFHVLFKR